MGGARTPHAWRMLAVKFFFLANLSAPAAVKQLAEKYGPLPTFVNRGFVRRWATHFEAHYTLGDLPRSGRKPKVPDELAEECAKRFAAGYHHDGALRFHYTSWHQACVLDPFFHAVCAHKEAKLGTLWARMRAVRPAIKKLPLEVKWRFSDADRALRMASARKLLRSPPDLRTAVFVDEASVMVDRASKRSVWIDTTDGKPHMLHLTERTAYRSKRKAKFYVAVNAVFGLLGVFFTTGTTKQPLAFTVRRAQTCTAACRRAGSA